MSLMLNFDDEAVFLILPDGRDIKIETVIRDNRDPNRSAERKFLIDAPKDIIIERESVRERRLRGEHMKRIGG